MKSCAFRQAPIGAEIFFIPRFPTENRPCGMESSGLPRRVMTAGTDTFAQKTPQNMSCMSCAGAERPRTDDLAMTIMALGKVQVAVLARFGLVRGSFIAPKDLRELRLVSRYRHKLSAM